MFADEPPQPHLPPAIQGTRKRTGRGRGPLSHGESKPWEGSSLSGSLKATTPACPVSRDLPRDHSTSNTTAGYSAIGTSLFWVLMVSRFPVWSRICLSSGLSVPQKLGPLLLHHCEDSSHCVDPSHESTGHCHGRYLPALTGVDVIGSVYSWEVPVSICALSGISSELEPSSPKPASAWTGASPIPPAQPTTLQTMHQNCQDPVW